MFSKHGRIATNIGKTQLIEYNFIHEAVAAFDKLFLELTGNTFPATNFKKQPNKYQPVNVRFDKRYEVLENLVESKLEPSVCELMKLLYDEEDAEDVTLKFELDIDLVPLGKVSYSQIRSAEGTLRELSELIKTNGTNDQFIQASNRFYTLIPHAFGFYRPVVINTAGMIANKWQMIDRLKNFEFTYSLLTEIKDQTNPLDVFYEKLNCDIAVLDKDSREYPEILKYVKNTQYDDWYIDCELEVEEVFKVSRHGEAERFKRHERNGNRQLLWRE